MRNERGEEDLWADQVVAGFPAEVSPAEAVAFPAASAAGAASTASRAPEGAVSPAAVRPEAAASRAAGVEAFPAGGAAASPAAASPGAEGSPADGAADFPAEAPPGAADLDAGEPLRSRTPPEKKAFKVSIAPPQRRGSEFFYSLQQNRQFPVKFKKLIWTY